MPPEPTTRPLVAPAREYTLTKSDDLARVLREAPAGSTITLGDAGPYDLTAGAGEEGGARLPADFTLRAASPARPVVRLGPAGEAAEGVRLGAGRVVIEGIDFQVTGGSGTGSRSAFLVAGTDLTVRRCSFRSAGPSAEGDPLAIFRLAAGADGDERPGPVTLESCVFDRGSAALWVQGRGDVLIRDSLFAPAAPAFRFEGPPTATEDAATVHLDLRHVSLQCETGPVFRIGGAVTVSIRLEDSVIAAIGDARTTLILADRPERVDWTGRGNLYGRIERFLQATGDAGGLEAVREFSAWAEDGEQVRERLSELSPRPVWTAAGPGRGRDDADPTHAFALDPIALTGHRGVGARKGPYGPLSTAPESIAAVSTPDLQASSPPGREPIPAQVPAPGSEPASEMPEPMVLAPDLTRSPAAPAESRPSPAPDPIAAAPIGPTPDSTVAGTAREGHAPTVPGAARVETGRDPNRARNSEELLAILRQPVAPSEPIRLAGGVEYLLPGCELAGNARWVLDGGGEPEAPRPCIRIRPDAGDQEPTKTRPALLRVLGPCLEVRNVDLVVDLEDAAPDSTTALFALGAGSDLSLNRCTITQIGKAPRSALIAVSRRAATEARVDAATTQVWINDSVLRAGSDLLDAAGGAPLEIEVTNSILASEGAFLHGRGSGGVGDESVPPPLKLELRQVACRVAGGLIHLESLPGGPNLPRVDADVRDSLLATTSDAAPLFRVDGQDNLEDLRDRIRWEGHGVAYHLIDIYRRDQSTRPGTVPLPFKRSDWEVAVGPREETPFHGELKFVAPWRDGKPLWCVTPEDFRLEEGGPAAASCPDLASIPTPPPLPKR
jgi:serine/threonine-protein kinase